MRARVALAFSFAFAIGAHAQTPTDTLAEARRLRDARAYAAAADLMRAYIDSHPDDAGSARFAALMAYWARRPSVADSLYGRALAGHGDDANLRLEYGRFLIETGDRARARDILTPMVSTDSVSFHPAEIARARTLLGTADYWSGDFTSARRQFIAALGLDSSVTDARRQLTEIETAAASWVRFSADLWDDDQPLRFATFGAEGGWFLNPLTPLGVRATSSLFDVDSTSESMLSAEGTFSTYVPAAHLDIAAAGGILGRSFARSTDWTGRAALGIRLPREVALQARYVRAPYTSTIRSLGQAVMVQTMDGGIRWGTIRGWMGEATGRLEIYPDDNHATTGFGWLLAPVVSKAAGTLHVGYGFTASAADRNRFAPRGDILVRPGEGPVPVAGEYDPYYTPRNLRAHSVLGSVRLAGGGRWSADANGRYAVSAHDDAPVLVALARPPTITVSRTFYRRSFHPWNARGSLDWPATRSVRVGLGVERGREAYYTYTAARVQLTYTFVAAALARAESH